MAEDAEKKQMSAYAMNLQQIDSGVIIPPSGWKCAKCDKTENLWLNLTDGVILCGRKNWDETGGNDHAVEHFRKTGYPLAVKLGTITADLEEADVFSYAEDDAVLDPLLAHHLAFFGIDRKLTSFSMGALFLALDPDPATDLAPAPDPAPDLAPAPTPTPTPIALEERYLDLFDWRAHGVLNGVRNQLHCNCCWAIVACEACEALLKILKQSVDLVQLSPQEIIDYVEPKPDALPDISGCFTGSMMNAYGYITKNGISLERNYPFEATRGAQRRGEEFEIWRIGGAKKMFKNRHSDKIIMKGVRHQPLGAAIQLTKEFKNLGSEIYMGGSDTTDGHLHAILIVGYGYDKVNDIYYWTIMNSYGKEWGENGFGRICQFRSLPPGVLSLISKVSIPILRKDGGYNIRRYM